jgi:hypothetical protein
MKQFGVGSADQGAGKRRKCIFNFQATVAAKPERGVADQLAEYEQRSRYDAPRRIRTG